MRLPTMEVDASREDSAVSVLGLGAMGSAMAAALLAAGHATTVWNRTPGRAEELVRQGATIGGSVAEAVDASPVVLVCLSDYDVVKEVLAEVSDFEGRALVNVSSGTPARARELAEWISDRDARYLDGAILDGPAAIGAGQPTTILYSGVRSTFDEHRVVLLSALGSGSQYLGEDAGRASLFDTAGLTMGWSVLNGFMQSAALLQASGADPREAVSIMVGTTKTVAGWLPEYAEQLASGDYAVLDADISTYFAAMASLVTESNAAGVNPSMPAVWTALAERAIKEGDGDRGYAAMIKQFRHAPPQEG